MRTLIGAIIIQATVVLAAPVSAAQVNQGFIYSNGQYTILSNPLAPTNTYAVGINNLGQVVGEYQTDAGSAPYVYGNGTYSTLPPVTDAHLAPRGINDLGQVVGWQLSASGGSQGFLYSNGNYTAFSAPLGTSTYAQGINDLGQIVGYYRNSAGGLDTFLYDRGSYTTLPHLGLYNVATGINNLGQIVGYYFTENGICCTGFVYSNGIYTTLSGSYVIPNGINDFGQIVGYDRIGSFIYTGGIYTHLSGPPDSLSSQAYGINDFGQVVGYYASGISSPVPEPSTWAMLLIGFAGIGLTAYRRRQKLYPFVPCTLLFNALRLAGLIVEA
jgi:probable HAF family extracellular repeat protein